jgi:transposase
LGRLPTQSVHIAPGSDSGLIMSRYDLTDFEWRVIEPLLPNKPRGVPRVDDRRVLNGIFWVLRSGAPWRDLPERYCPRTTCYNRFVRWRKAGVWGRLMESITASHDGGIQMIDSTSVRAHQQAATAKKGGPDPCLGRSRADSRPRYTSSLTRKDSRSGSV